MIGSRRAALAAALGRLGGETHFSLPEITTPEIAEAAERLGVSNTVVKRLIKAGTLPAKQVVRYAPWIIEVTDLDLPEVQTEARAVRRGRKLPHSPPGQQNIPL